MATPVRSLNSSDVATGDPTRESHYDNLRTDMMVALTEYDYGATGSTPSSPVVGQKWMDTTLDTLYICFDGTNFVGAANAGVEISDYGIEVTTGKVVYLAGSGGLVVPVGTDKYVTSGPS